MQSVECGQCGVVVLAEKFSDRHTSVQWLGSSSSCPRLSGQGAMGDRGERKTVCPSLHATIDEASHSGRLPLTHRGEPRRAAPGRVG